MKPFMLNYFGNPSSSHVYGSMSKTVISNCRQDVLRLLNGNANDLTIFTGNGTESDNGAITISLHHYKSLLKITSDALPRVVTSSIEHPGILKYLSHLENMKQIEVRIVPVNDEGISVLVLKCIYSQLRVLYIQ